MSYVQGLGCSDSASGGCGGCSATGCCGGKPQAQGDLVTFGVLPLAIIGVLVYLTWPSKKKLDEGVAESRAREERARFTPKGPTKVDMTVY